MKSTGIYRNFYKSQNKSSKAFWIYYELYYIPFLLLITFIDIIIYILFEWVNIVERQLKVHQRIIR